MFLPSIFSKPGTLLLILAFFSAPLIANEAKSTAALLEKSRDISMQLQTALGKRLKSVIEEHSIEDAIRVCAKDAPSIAERISADNGARVGRVALRTRNPGNQAGAHEEKILQDFAQLMASGKNKQPETLIALDDGSHLYMRAIPTQALCLTCHGENINPLLEKQIRFYYPNDDATGFALGELRGAFVVKWP